MPDPSRTLILFLSGPPDPGPLDRCLREATRRGEEVHAISELRLELDAKAISRTSTLDEFRTPDLTIRRAADHADALLRDLRSTIGERFSHMGRSLWVANETNFLHFHLLRVIDLSAVVGRAFDELRPARVVCLGPVDNLAKLAGVVARQRGVACELPVSRDDRRRALSVALWRLQQLLFRVPTLYLLASECMLAGRSLLSRRAAAPPERAVTEPESIGSGMRVTLLGTNSKQSDILAQLFRHLTTDGRHRCRIVNIEDRLLLAYFEARGIESRMLGEWSSARATLQERVARRRFLREARELFAAPEFRARFVYQGVDLWPLVCHRLTRIALVVAPSLCGVAERFRDCLTESPADIVVTPAEWMPASRACVIAASDRGARSLSVQRGDISAFPGWGEPIFSDMITVNGPAVERALRTLRVPEHQIAVTGDPRLDPWCSPAGFFERGRTRQTLGIPEDRRLIAVMTNPVTLNETAGHTEDYVGALLELEASDASLHFVIKLHPNEYDFAFYERIRDRTGAENVTIVKDLDTPQLLYDADVVVTTVSTTGEEAIFLGKPLIVVHLTNEPDFMPYVGHPAALTVRDRTDIGPALRTALEDEGARERLRSGRSDYVREHFLSDDGRSSERCAAVMESLVRGTPHPN